MVNSYSSINLKSLVSVKASPNNSDVPLIVLDLSEKATEKSGFYRSGYNKLRGPDSTFIKMENSVVIFTGSQTTSQQVVNAVKDLTNLCN